MITTRGPPAQGATWVAVTGTGGARTGPPALTSVGTTGTGVPGVGAPGTGAPLAHPELVSRVLARPELVRRALACAGAGGHDRN